MNGAHRTTSPSPSDRPAPPKVYLLISVLIGLTATRALAMLFIPMITMFGGTAPDAWVGPWVTDAILGLLIPVVIIALYRLCTARAWGCLLLYNGIGAFDYASSLVTQLIHPLPASIAPPGLVSGSLSFTLCLQFVVIVLLFRRDVIHDFFRSA